MLVEVVKHHNALLSSTTPCAQQEAYMLNQLKRPCWGSAVNAGITGSSVRHNKLYCNLFLVAWAGHIFRLRGCTAGRKQQLCRQSQQQLGDSASLRYQGWCIRVDQLIVGDADQLLASSEELYRMQPL